jgi:hypothetical protein
MHVSTRLCPCVRDIPGRAHAERVLAAAWTGGRPFFAAAFLADHVPETLEADYRKAENLLGGFFAALSEALRPSDRVYRWSCTSFLALLERSGSWESVRQEMDRLPLEGAREVFPLTGCGSPEQICHQIDLFVAGNL